MLRAHPALKGKLYERHLGTGMVEMVFSALVSRVLIPPVSLHLWDALTPGWCRLDTSPSPSWLFPFYTLDIACKTCSVTARSG